MLNKIKELVIILVFCLIEICCYIYFYLELSG